MIADFLHQHADALQFIVALACFGGAYGILGLLSGDGKFERHRGRVVGSKLSEETLANLNRGQYE